MTSFIKIACAGSKCLNFTDINRVDWQSAPCTLCDASCSITRGGTLHWDQKSPDEMWKDVIAGMIAITREEKFQHSSRPRVLMAVAIGRVFNHISDAEYLSLDVSPLGEWLLKSMQRSLRELRIAASRSLMTFLRDDISRQVRDKNRRATMQFLAELTRRNVPAQQETLIMAYGQAARTCSGEELHIILGQLVRDHARTEINCTFSFSFPIDADFIITCTGRVPRPHEHCHLRCSIQRALCFSRLSSIIPSRITAALLENNRIFNCKRYKHKSTKGQIRRRIHRRNNLRQSTARSDPRGRSASARSQQKDRYSATNCKRQQATIN